MGLKTDSSIFKSGLNIVDGILSQTVVCHMPSVRQISTHGRAFLLKITLNWLPTK